MSSGNNPISQRIPFELDGKAEPEVVSAIRYQSSGIVDLNQAIRVLKTQVDTAQATATSVQTTVEKLGTGVTSFNTETGDVIYFPYLGTVNDQLGIATYVTQNTDNGAKIIVGDSSAVTLSLNSLISAPWFAFIDNDSSTTATLSPTSGVVHGPSRIPPGASGIIFFDGTDWWASSTSGNTPRSVAANYSINPGADYVILCTNAITITLPSAVGLDGQEFVIKNTNPTSGSLNVDIATTGGQLIDGLASPATIGPLSALTLISDNSGWWIV